MKKAISLLLALALCLSLCACGGGNDTLTTNEGSGNNQTQESDNTDNGETELLPFICGEWKPLYTYDEQILTNVSIFDDKTINIDDSSFSWELDYTEDSEARFNVLDNESKVGYFELSISENTDIELQLEMDTFDKAYSANGTVVLYKPSHYEIIPITLDNFYEYFEIRYFPHIEKNEFDEISGIKFYCSYALKEEFYARISHLMMDDTRDVNVVDNGAAEFSFERGDIECLVDVENQTFEIVGFTPYTSGEEDTIILSVNFGGMWTPDTYGFNFANYTFRTNSNLDLENGTGHNNNMGHNYELVRITATLYLLAEND